MYNSLKEKIQNAQYFTDLLPLIASLFTFDHIKTDLISALDKKYKATVSMESEQNSKIRPIFVALNTFNGIPSDVMHANIISFLPSRDYKKLPLVSKNFRNIMLKYPFIYNGPCQYDRKITSHFPKIHFSYIFSFLKIYFFFVFISK